MDAVAVGLKVPRVHKRRHDPVMGRHGRTAVHSVVRLPGGAKAGVNSEARVVAYGVMPFGVPAVPNQTH